MSVLTLKRREKKIERIYFIPAGAVVDGVTVAIATWPDASPTTNWTDYQYDDIEKLKPERETVKEEFIIPGATGYIRDTTETVIYNSYSATTAKTNALVKQLEYGLASIPVAGVAQAPRARKENYLDGVMLREVLLESTGTVTERHQTWARKNVTDFGESGNATSKVQVKFTEMESANNTVLIVA
jgi:hypothetical protein